MPINKKKSKNGSASKESKKCGSEVCMAIYDKNI